MIRRGILLGLLLCAVFMGPARAQSRHTLSVSGTSFLLNGAPFPYTGISFFNAVYNPSFNKRSEERRQWEKFQRYGINSLRVWAQWDTRRSYADTCGACTLYFPDGRLRDRNVARLKEIIADADRLGMVIELVLFSQESWHANIRLGPEESHRAVTALTRELLPYRNMTFEIWNEFSERVLDHLKTIEAIDPGRLATNSPGGAGILGDREQNEALDYLSPYPTRQSGDRCFQPQTL
ncbi:MAG TPA: hypothetical protein VFA54_10635 [Bryobacterales bacterium]|jgi:hypothetical protein|nr:hypothetical protein [Bryobacterales bacterium]